MDVMQKSQKSFDFYEGNAHLGKSEARNVNFNCMSYLALDAYCREYGLYAKGKSKDRPSKSELVKMVREHCVVSFEDLRGSEVIYNFIKHLQKEKPSLLSPPEDPGKSKS